MKTLILHRITFIIIKITLGYYKTTFFKKNYILYRFVLVILLFSTVIDVHKNLSLYSELEYNYSEHKILDK